MARFTGLLLLAVLAAALRSIAWVSPAENPGVPRVGVQRCAQVDPGDCKAVRNDAVSGVQLPSMDEDEPAWLAFVIARYLDEEWVEQPVHKEIGEAVAKIYRESRAEGDDDLIAVLAKLSFGLKDMWRSAGFGDAFEGPVDVANRVAELLMLRQGGEVWSYGRSNSDVQQKMLKRLEEYEEVLETLHGDLTRAFFLEARVANLPLALAQYQSLRCGCSCGGDTCRCTAAPQIKFS